MQGLRARLHERWQKERLRPDLSRAARCVVAFMVPILAAQAGWLPIDATFAGIAAQNIALVDIRGPYPLRIGLSVQAEVDTSDRSGPLLGQPASPIFKQEGGNPGDTAAVNARIAQIIAANRGGGR